MKKQLPGNCLLTIIGRLPSLNLKALFSALCVFSFIAFSYSQGNGNGNGGGGNKDIVVRACVESIGNGLFRVNFGYDNPNKKEVTVAEDNSYVVRGNSMSKGPNKFKKGNHNNVFTREISGNEVVAWTVINPSGREFTVTASANSSHCPEGEGGFIFPVFDQGDGKDETLIGSELTSLATGNAGDTPSEIIYQINSQDKVLVEIVPRPGQKQAVLNLLSTTFNLQFNTDPTLSDFVVDPTLNVSAFDVFFPVSRLLELNDYPQLINFVRPLYKTINNIGIVTSQGDGAQKSDAVRNSFTTVINGERVFLGGQGLKVGVISDSFDTQPFTGQSKATVDIGNGDLPGPGNPEGNIEPVEIIKDFPYGEASDEGRAMLQIIHDIAPKAALGFSTGISSPREFELAVKDFDARGYQVAIDDVTFPANPFFPTGTDKIAAAIQEFTSKPGNAYFTSAGNFANAGYQSEFNNSTSTPVTNFLQPGLDTRAHVFDNSGGTEDIIQKISVVPGTYMLVLQWSEGYASQENVEGADTDLDFYVVDHNLNLLVGNNRINTDGDSTEFLVFQAQGSGEANIMITSANGPVPEGLTIRFVAFISNGLTFVEYGGAPTVTGHAMTPEAITVAAVDYRAASSPVAQSFSSFGGAISNHPSLEIDLAAPDGGNINVNSIGVDIADDEDNFTNFFGTSAAAPHAAGLYILMRSAVNTWYPGGLPEAVPVKSNLLADQIINRFKTTAVPAGSADVAGAGLIDGLAAFTGLAAQTAHLTDLEVEAGKTPSAEPFEVTISGEFLPESPTVLFDGEQLELVSNSDTEIVARVNEFFGNPELIVRTDPITPGGTDGGDSNPLYFFEGDKIALNIIAEDISIVFGSEVNFNFRVEGLPEGVSYESLGLPNITYDTPALFPYPDVNSYLITPGLETPLSQEQMENFQLNFISGILEVTPRDMNIAPVDATFTYGDPIVMDLSYTFPTDGITNTADFLSTIENAHQGDFFPDNTLALLNRFTAVINDYDILEELSGGSWLASERTIQNRFTAVINDMNLINFEIEDFTNYLDEFYGGTTNRFTAVINRFTAVVNGEDLFRGDVEIFESLTNRFTAVINDSGLGNPDDPNNYEQVFTLIDIEDGSETGERTIETLYSLNLITGLGVTTTLDDRHYVYPGSLINSISANLNLSYSFGRITIDPAVLTASTTGDIFIYAGDAVDTSELSVNFDGFKYEETVADIFPDGIPFYFEDAAGNEYTDGDTGVFFVKVRDPENYIVAYENLGTLFVSERGRKVRALLDCVEFDPDASGLNYIAHYRYDNPNDHPVYVALGADNNLSGNAVFQGDPPVVFLPGEGTFEIRFDGNLLKWTLTTWHVQNNGTSTSTSNASASSKLCDPDEVSGIISGVVFTLYPNPVSTTLTVDQSIAAGVTLEVFDIFAQPLLITSWNQNSGLSHQVDMSAYPQGMYFIRLTVGQDNELFSVIKL